MPRKANPGLGAAIASSALQIIDEVGLSAMTMRDVARRAHTSTPTLYERFYEREALLQAVVELVQADLYRNVLPTSSLPEMSAALLDYAARYPGRLELINLYWPRLLSTDKPKPTFDLARKRFMEDLRYSQEDALEAAQALTALLVGTATLMRNADGPVATNLRNATLRTVREICQNTGR